MEIYEIYIIIFKIMSWREATWKTQAKMEVGFEMNFKLTSCEGVYQIDLAQDGVQCFS